MILECDREFNNNQERMSFVPSLPPELEEAKRAGMIAAADPAVEEEDEGIEVRV